MAIDILHNPPALSFSANHINAVFQCLDYLDQAGECAVNSISFSPMPSENTVINIAYGQNTIAMTAKSYLNNDFSGNNYVNTDMDSVLWSFKANYKLSEDFIITKSGTNLILTAKKAGPQYNFTSGGSNTIAGIAEVIKPNFSVFFKLYIENEDYNGFKEIYTSNIQLLPGSNGKAEAVLGDKLHVEMSNSLRQGFPDQPAGTPLLCKRSCRKYFFEFAESYGTTPKPKALHTSQIFTAIHGGLSTLAEFKTTISNLINPSSLENDKFLRQGFSTIPTRSNQPNYLYFYNSRSTKTVKLIVKYTFTDATTYIQEKSEFEMLNDRKYGFETRFDQLYENFSPGKTVKQYEVYLTSGGDRVSEIRTYVLDYTTRSQVRYFLYWSSFGSLDTLACYGKGESEFELFSNSASRQHKRGDNIKAGKSLTYNSKIKRSFKVATGFVTASQVQLNSDFFLSNLKYRYNAGNMLPIEVLPGKVPELADGNNLHAQTFEYKYHYDDHSYTEGDAEETGVSIPGFFFSGVGLTPSDVFQETDPTVPQHVKEITLDELINWRSGGLIDISNYYNKTQSDQRFAGKNDLRILNGQTAFTWGNHAGIYQPKEDQRLSSTDDAKLNSLELALKLLIPHNLGSTRKVSLSAATDGSGGSIPPPPLTEVSWADILGPLSGSTALMAALNDKVDILGYNKTSWDSAFANSHTHSNMSALNLITSLKISNWDASYSWGNHSGLYQEKENQRLSTTNNVVFNSAELTSKLNIPHNLGSSRKVSISAATDGSGGSTPPPPITAVTWGMITGSLSAQNDLATALNGKAPLSHTHTIAQITGLQAFLDGKEAAFTKNTAFNKNFGTASGTVAQGNDSRILNGQTAFGWGNHAGLYALLAGSYANPSWITSIANSKVTGLGTYALRSAGLAELTGANFTGNISAPVAEITSRFLIPHNLGSTRKVSMSAASDGSGGSTPPPPITAVNWGMIAGSLSAQTDLATALNSKAPLNGVGATGTWGIGITGNAATASKLLTARTLWGQLFDGLGNITGDMSGVAGISMTGNLVQSATGMIENRFLDSDGTSGLVSFKNVKAFSSAGTLTGSIKIKLPKLYTESTMWTMTLKIYEYANIQNSTIKITGYTSTANHMVWCDTPDLFSQVRFGYDSTTNEDVILIDKISGSYSIAKVIIEEFTVSHTLSRAAKYKNPVNYSISITSDEANYVHRITKLNSQFKRDLYYLNAANLTGALSGLTGNIVKPITGMYENRLIAGSAGITSFKDIVAYTTSATPTGAIKITLPQPHTWTTTWWLTVEIYEYTSSSTNLLTTIKILGYSAANGFVVSSDNPNYIDSVRTGYDSTSLSRVIWISKSSAWLAPKVIIRDFTISNANADNALLKTQSNYSVTITSDETGYVNQATKLNANFARDNYYLNASNLNSGILAAARLSGSYSINAATATALQTPRSIWGQLFDATGSVSGAMTGVTDITGSGKIAMPNAEFSTTLRIPHNLGSTRKVSLSAASDGSGGSVPPPPLTSVSWADIIGPLSGNATLSTALNGKAALSHTHPISDITGLQTQLNSLAPLNGVGATGTWGISINGNAATVTNGVYTTSNQSIGGVKTFTSTIVGNISGNAGSVTNGLYSNGTYNNPSWLTGLAGSKITGDITGNAAGATSWNGWTHNYYTEGPTLGYLFGGDGTSGVQRFYGKSFLKTWLNIGDSSTLANNISGSAVKWNNMSYVDGDSAPDTYLMAYKGGNNWGNIGITNLRTWLQLFHRNSILGTSVGTIDVNTYLPNGGFAASYSTSTWATNGPASVYGGIISYKAEGSPNGLNLFFSNGHDGDPVRVWFRGINTSGFTSWREMFTTIGGTITGNVIVNAVLTAQQLEATTKLYIPHNLGSTRKVSISAAN